MDWTLLYLIYCVMCGRYAVVSKVKTIEKKFGVDVDNVEIKPNTNVSIGELAPVIASDNPGAIQLFQFGFTPSWAQKQSYVINARAEGDYNKDNNTAYSGSKGIISKPMFRKAIRSQRCLVIADCFIEGPTNERLNKPYVIYPINEKGPFAFAGIWDTWVDEVNDQEVKSFAIITAVSNSITQMIKHHRSPVILDESTYEDWVNPDLPLADATSLLKPYPGELLNAYPVSKSIKSPKVNGVELLEPIGERLYPQYKYSIYEELSMHGMGELRARDRKNNEGIQGSLF